MPKGMEDDDCEDVGDCWSEEGGYEDEDCEGLPDAPKESDDDEEEDDSEGDDGSSEDEDCSEQVVTEGCSGFPLMSLHEFVCLLGKRTAMVAQGADSTLPFELQQALLSELKSRQDGELHRWAEALTLGEFASGRLPVKPTTLGRRLDPNTTELAFHPQRDHQLSVDLPWVWDVVASMGFTRTV